MLEVLAEAFNWLLAHPGYAFVAYLLFNIVKQKMTPFPEAGGLTRGARTTDEFYGAIADAKAKRRLVVADFYATWCPPCRAAAPIFGRMSEKWAGCDFVKLDVDECKGVAKREGISAMPTFKIFANGECAWTGTGFNPAEIEKQLTALGAKPGGSKDD